MEPIESDSTTTGIQAQLQADVPSIPNWVDEEHFIDAIKEHVNGFISIVEFEPKLMGGAGENYGSVMFRIRVAVEVEANSTKNMSLVLKTMPQSEQSAMVMKVLRLFSKESAVYEQCLPEFTQMYREVGQDVVFGPKMFKLKKDPEADYILLDDLHTYGFKNINRLEGCDKEHSEAVLRLLAKLHAASAVQYELKGQYEEILTDCVFTEKNREIINALGQSLVGVFLACLSEYQISHRLCEKVTNLVTHMTDKYIELGTPDPDAFSVINHGDLWANNIMFRHNDEGKIEDVLFVDFQVSRYASPAIDLLYFLMSSTKLELKVSHFDYFIQFYHDHLVENLKLLGYPKKIPTLKDLRFQLLKYSVWAFSTIWGTLGVALLDPTKDASMDNFMGEGEDATKYKMKIYKNPRFVKHFQTVLPWLDSIGFLD